MQKLSPERLRFLVALAPVRDLFLFAKHLFIAAMAVKGPMSVSRLTPFWDLFVHAKDLLVPGGVPRGKRPHPQAGGRVRTGPRWAERIKLDPPYSAGGSNVGGENILPTLGPIPLGRSALVRGFTPDICLFAPEICLMEPQSDAPH